MTQVNQNMVKVERNENEVIYSCELIRYNCKGEPYVSDRPTAHVEKCDYGKFSVLCVNDYNYCREKIYNNEFDAEIAAMKFIYNQIKSNKNTLAA